MVYQQSSYLIPFILQLEFSRGLMGLYSYQSIQADCHEFRTQFVPPGSNCLGFSGDTFYKKELDGI